MRLRLAELVVGDGQAWKIRAKKLGKNQQDSDGILHHQSVPYISKIIRNELISSHYNDQLASYFGIEKIREFVTKNNYRKAYCHDVEFHVRRCDVCIASKTVKYKPHKTLQQFRVSTYF